MVKNTRSIPAEDLKELGWENIDVQMNSIYAEKAGKKFYVDLDSVEWK